MSGKTYLAKALARGHMARGVGVIVLDPMGDSWPCHRQHGDMGSFLRSAKAAEGCLLVVDEVGQTVGRHPPPEVEWLATRARHWGHRVIFIGQDPTQVQPIIREQTSDLWLFRMSPKRCELWAEDFADRQLMEATKLNKYEFLHKRRFEPARKLKLS
jgi:hypothetical protein